MGWAATTALLQEWVCLGAILGVCTSPGASHHHGRAVRQPGQRLKGRCDATEVLTGAAGVCFLNVTAQSGSGWVEL